MKWLATVFGLGGFYSESAAATDVGDLPAGRVVFGSGLECRWA